MNRIMLLMIGLVLLVGCGAAPVGDPLPTSLDGIWEGVIPDWGPEPRWCMTILDDKIASMSAFCQGDWSWTVQGHGWTNSASMEGANVEIGYTDPEGSSLLVAGTMQADGTIVGWFRGVFVFDDEVDVAEARIIMARRGP